MKKIFLLIGIITMICLCSSCGTSYSPGYSSSPRSDAYSQPSREGVCHACNGRGYIMRNGVRETCGACGGTGKSVSFPDAKK